ncbi:type II toxin-antitoxin system RelE/ParE family toxin, partial [Erwinia sp. MYb416]|uniref:type II toxin-antitoxin system RelE/ParE family toxin n=2 Tax=Erwinia sp. MYb416 TaxID=3108532 RepID=UPI003098BD3D
MNVSWTAKARGDLARIHRFELNSRAGGPRRANRIINSLLNESIDIDLALPIIKGRQLKDYLPRQVYRVIVIKEYEMHFEIDTAQNNIYILD